MARAYAPALGAGTQVLALGMGTPSLAPANSTPPHAERGLGHQPSGR